MSKLKFRIRCSKISDITGKAKGGITEKQLQQLAEFEARIKIGNPLTEKQTETFEGLKLKKKAGNPLSETAKSYLREWFLENTFDRRKTFSSKYTEKGITQEDEGIDLYSKWSGREFLQKNEIRFENEFMTGEPDVFDAQDVIDLKCSWDLFSFPYFEKECFNNNYYEQLQGYMILKREDQRKNGIKEEDLVNRGLLVYALVNTPDDLIMKEYSSLQWKQVGVRSEEIDSQMMTDLEKALTFDDIPLRKRIRVFEIPFDPEFEEKLRGKVKKCQEYVDELSKRDEEFGMIKEENEI